MSAEIGASPLGTGWGFPPQFGSDGVLRMAHAEQDVRESLRIILATTPGERVMHPTFGCGLNALVFEMVSETLRTRIRDLVTRAVRQFEPRVEVSLVAVHTDAADPALLNIELAYCIRATNTPANLVFPFYLGGGAHAPAAVAR
jgi:phage baseplate assembly protein W